ncbi:MULTISPECIES: helix-turn-helix domain-containing protein [Alphaproteobacteria]|uniref:helix-turn-helix domain-containing protein n=1 Tax=Alphaproteobacteria TaxID=28211 RepID=UPI0011BE14D9|nr:MULTISPECIES: XRE family transcriptional regulator [Alphaproteobacteria]
MHDEEPIEAGRAIAGDRMQNTSVSELGGRIRLRRKVKRLTLAQVAEAAGISTAQLSQIERGNAMPSVDKLVLLCQAIDMPVSWLFDGADHTGPASTESRLIVRKAKRRHIVFQKNGMEKDMLTPDSMPQIQMMRLVLSPDGTTGDMPYNEKEGAKCGLLLRGSISLEIDGEVYRLYAGDSFAFSATALIRFWAEGEESEIIWACTPAFY